MKLIIDIPKEIYKASQIVGDKFDDVIQIPLEVIANCTPIPDNATNGDVIKAMFDVTEEHFYDEDRMVDVYGLDRIDDPSTFYADWWNAPYNAERR